MSSPITNKIGAVFIPVSDMPSAIAWYSQLLGLPPQATSHEGRIYDLPMQGELLIGEYRCRHNRRVRSFTEERR